jgi:glycosyltransferase involved in cell wall biosynthesis
MAASSHILINGLSIGSGGGYTVARELLRHLTVARPEWRATLALIRGHPLHERLNQETWPANASLLYAPSAAIARWRRNRYETRDLTRWAAAEHVSAVVQLNGMVVPGMPAPTLCHNQDPWPYRPQAWNGLRDRALAMLKRRAHARALRRAAFVGFTSAYLRDLICGYHGLRPGRTAVFYNGVPEAWLGRARSQASDAPQWEARPLELLSVSNVQPYKRQSMVIQALPALVRHAGLETLTYRIAGECDPRYQSNLERLAKRLGVGGRVVFEGRVTDARVQELFGRARAFVLMSVCESFGIPAIEAMSFGAPVVTTDCCAMPEVCGDAADLCPADDLDGLVVRLKRVLLDAAHAEELRRRGFERVGRFRWSHTAEQMATALEEITQPRSAQVALA